MNPLFGEYPCKVDAKGRFLLPAALLRLLPADAQRDFVLNRGLDGCLVLYPMSTWQRELANIHAQNQYVAENRAFARLFQAGAQPVELDSAKRILIPKRLMEAADVQDEVVLVGAYDRIEVWGSARYEQWLATQQPNFEQLSSKVMSQGNMKGGTA